MMSFGIAMATFTAQNYGAKEYGRILQGVRQTLLMSVGFSLLAGAIVIFFGHFFVQLFVSPSETRVFELAQTYFNINGSLYWILAVLFILRYTLQGLGQSKIPTIAGMMELLMRSLQLSFLQECGDTQRAAASPLAWIGSVAVLLYSYMRSMKQLKHMGEEEHFTLEHAEAR